MVIVNKTGTERESVNFPEGYSFRKSDNWIELILPSDK